MRPLPRLAATACALTVVAGPTAFAAVPAGAATGSTVSTVSTRTLLGQLGVAAEHGFGYSRDKFAGWRDADRDGCDTREEVLLAEALRTPVRGAGCAVTATWSSRYDAQTVRIASGLDIDHMVPLAEAWHSGAWRWTSATRAAYANDLGYAASLIAVTASTNRSKSDREPHAWMPPNGSFHCTYVARWVAVKARWRLKVNGPEKTFLAKKLTGCGWPRVAAPGRPSVSTASGGTTSGGTTGGTAADPRYGTCAEAIDHGFGNYVAGRDAEYSWYRDGDSDGVACET